MDKKKIGRYIQQKRKEKQLSQNDIAKLLYCTDSAVSRWECGVGLPDIELLEPLCQCLGISLASFLAGEDTDVELSPEEKRSIFNEIVNEKEYLEQKQKNLFSLISVLSLIIGVLAVFGIFTVFMITGIISFEKSADEYYKTGQYQKAYEKYIEEGYNDRADLVLSQWILNVVFENNIPCPDEKSSFSNAVICKDTLRQCCQSNLTQSQRLLFKVFLSSEDLFDDEMFVLFSRWLGINEEKKQMEELENRWVKSNPDYEGYKYLFVEEKEIGFLENPVGVNFEAYRCFQYMNNSFIQNKAPDVHFINGHIYYIDDVTFRIYHLTNDAVSAFCLMDDQVCVCYKESLYALSYDGQQIHRIYHGNSLLGRAMTYQDGIFCFSEGDWLVKFDCHTNRLDLLSYEKEPILFIWAYSATHFVYIVKENEPIDLEISEGQVCKTLVHSGPRAVHKGDILLLDVNKDGTMERVKVLSYDEYGTVLLYCSDVEISDNKFEVSEIFREKMHVNDWSLMLLTNARINSYTYSSERTLNNLELYQTDNDNNTVSFTYQQSPLKEQCRIQLMGFEHIFEFLGSNKFSPSDIKSLFSGLCSEERHYLLSSFYLTENSNRLSYSVDSRNGLISLETKPEGSYLPFVFCCDLSTVSWGKAE